MTACVARTMAASAAATKERSAGWSRRSPVWLRKTRQSGRVRRLRSEVQQRAADLDAIDRDSAWVAKRTALKLLHQAPRSAGRELAYAAFRDREGGALDDFATWCALAEKYGGDWHHWPSFLQQPTGAGVARFVEKHSDTVDFHRWMQWQLDEAWWLSSGLLMPVGPQHHPELDLIGRMCLEPHRAVDQRGKVLVGLVANGREADHLGQQPPYTRCWVGTGQLFEVPGAGLDPG